MNGETLEAGAFISLTRRQEKCFMDGFLSIPSGTLAGVRIGRV